MKKNVLALSITAAIGAFGMIGSAQAITDLGVNGTVGLATQMKVNNAGIGHNLIVPYYTAQAANATLITLTNTTAVGKAVKLRFRGAENSDDVKDFQVFLSPFDVWTANISQSATGEAQITTTDRSCTKPTFVAGTSYKFGTDRLSTAANVAGTREGYIEIFNMADIPVTAGATTLSGTTTHSQPAGTVTCTGTAWNTLDTDTTGATLLANGLALPTTGLSASWIIINTATGAAYGANATAIQALNAAGNPATGNLVYWPQSTAFVSGETRGYTADPLLAGNLTAGVVPPIKALMQDLPDMSTPYVSGLVSVATGATTSLNNAGAVSAYAAGDQWAATAQAYELTKALAATSVNNEFFSDSATVQVGAAPDWVFSMATRRYTVAQNYAVAAAAGRTFTNYTLSQTGAVVASATPAIEGRKVNYFTLANTSVQGTTICVDGITPVAYNREEGTNSSVAFSPSASPVFCGETGVWGVNQTLTSKDASAVLSGALTTKGITFAPIAISEGWMTVATPGLTTPAAAATATAAAGSNLGLPVLGSAFTKASSTASTNYGWNTEHKVTRAAGFGF